MTTLPQPTPASFLRRFLPLLILLVLFLAVEFLCPRFPDNDEVICKAAGRHLGAGGSFSAPELEGFLHLEPPVERVFFAHPRWREEHHQYERLMSWVDRLRKLDVRTNADPPEQVEDAVAFGAQGIGLCRTEHTLDQTGVGQLMQIAVEKGRSSRANIKLGIYGEHGGDPESVKFCHRLGLDCVSCSPFRVPIARLTAAQAALAEK
jgi:hypothetical protein